MSLYQHYKKRWMTVMSRLISTYCIMILRLCSTNLKFLSKDEWASMVTEMMANDKFIQESTRCVMKMMTLWLNIVLCPIQMTPEKP